MDGATDDEVRRVLKSLTGELRNSLRGVAEITTSTELPNLSDPIWVTRLTPANPQALALQFADYGHALHVDLLPRSGIGSEWEPDRTTAEAGRLADIVRSVVPGRVTVVRAPGRALFEVALSDGITTGEILGTFPMGCLPIPGWIRRGTRIPFDSYS
jgi:hypothetical protein